MVVGTVPREGSDMRDAVIVEAVRTSVGKADATVLELL
jgi:hypothetical protein